MELGFKYFIRVIPTGRYDLEIQIINGMKAQGWEFVSSNLNIVNMELLFRKKDTQYWVLVRGTERREVFGSREEMEAELHRMGSGARVVEELEEEKFSRFDRLMNFSSEIDEPVDSKLEDKRENEFFDLLSMDWPEPVFDDVDFFSSAEENERIRQQRLRHDQ